jgi:hypothetical protein
MRCGIRFRAALILFAIPATSGAFADSITREMVEDDARLNTLLSITSSRLYVGDLLDRIGRQTGIKVTPRRSDRSGDDQILVCLRGVPAWRVMDGLWSLLSYKGAEYHWERTGSSAGFEYELWKPLNARGFPERMQHFAVDALEKNLDVMLQLAEMEPRERAKAADRLSRSLLQSDNTSAKQLITNETLWPGLRLIDEILPRTERSRWLKQGGYRRIPVEELGPNGRKYVQDLWKRDGASFKQKNLMGQWEQMPPPSSVEIRVERHNRITPSVELAVGGMGSQSYAGGLPLKLGMSAHLEKLWILPGDEGDNEGISDLVSSRTREPSIGPNNTTIRQRLRHLSGAVPVFIMARIPDGPTGQLDDPGSPAGVLVRTFLAKLRGPLIKHHIKWRDNLLLVADSCWFWETNRMAPWDVVRSLRSATKRGNGYLPWDEVVRMAVDLTDDQLFSLQAEFPEARIARKWRGLFRICDRSKEMRFALASELGMKCDREVVDNLTRDEVVARHFEINHPSAIRIYRTDVEKNGEKCRLFRLQMFDKQAVWRSVIGWYVAPHKVPDD